MEFGIEKCAMPLMKSGKHKWLREWHYRIKTCLERVEKTKQKYLGILQADTIKQVQMKDKIQEEYFRGTRKLLETKLSSRNFTKGINTWAVTLVRYSVPFLKLSRDDR